MPKQGRIRRFFKGLKPGAILFWLFKRPLLWIPLAALCAVPILLVFYYSSWAMAFDLDKVSQMPQTSIIYDRNGYPIQRLYEENRIIVDSKAIPEVVRDAFIAKEDERFKWHFGFDPIAIFRSLAINITHRGIRTGASTITQQLARNSADMFQRTFDRKVKEIFLAMRIEMVFSKDEIMTYYLNRIYFGGNIYGIGAAADAYFGKLPKDLNLQESALLAGIVAGPNSLSPWRNPTRAKEARAFTLDRMAACGFITDQQAATAKEQPIVLRPLAGLPGSYVTGAVLEALPDFLSREIIFRGGLRIYTTVDLAFQKNTEQAIETTLTKLEATPGYKHTTRRQWLASEPPEGVATPYLQGAFVAIDNNDGGILCLVGGRNFEESSFNRAITGPRQIGSTMKPFIYAHAFNTLNFTAFTEVDASTFDLTQASMNDVVLSPHPKYITVREALQTSNNYAVMRTGLAAGLPEFCYFFEQATGVLPPPYASTLLGAIEVTPLKMAAAYSAFANYGVEIKPYLLKEVYTADGKLVYKHIDERKRILSPQVAFQINHLLQGNVDHGTGSQLRSTFDMKGQIGGKTGTTNDYKDAWFAGFDTRVTAVAWVGLDKPQTVMAGGYATRLAVPLWGAAMKPALEHYPPEDFVPPPGVSMAKTKKEQSFFFFKTTTVSSSAEYIRDDQRGTATARLDPQTLEKLQQATEEPPMWKKALDLIWSPEPPDKFAPSQEQPEGQAVINDNAETHAPRAVPVQQGN